MRSDVPYGSYSVSLSRSGIPVDAPPAKDLHSAGDAPNR